MSKWLNDGEVLVGQGSGEAVPMSPSPRSKAAGSPRPGRDRGHHGPLTSPREASSAGSPQAETMGKAKELFLLCDKEGKGFITKRDMQRLQTELPLSPEQLETVFESLDRESNGFVTPLEFNTGLGGLMGLGDMTELSPDEVEEEVDGQVDWLQDAAAVRFVNILMELGADKLFEGQQELCSLWCELQKNRPELLSVLEKVLMQTLSHLQDANRERDSLELVLRRRESEHHQIVQSIYEEMEIQQKQERQKHQAQDIIRLMQRVKRLEEELRSREPELENSLSRQKELETRVRQLSCEQTNVKEQNLQLRSLNVQLQEQVESGRERLQAAVGQLELLQHAAAQEQTTRQRNVMKVSRNIQKEKDSLLKQLELLRDMNKRLRDEKDAQQQSQKRNFPKTLQKKGSIIGHYLLQDQPLKRQLSSSDESETKDKDAEVENTSKRHQASRRVRDHSGGQTQSSSVGPQRVFKVVFMGNSGVGKSSFIQHYCTGSFLSGMSATVGLDSQMKTVSVDSTTVALQLWDTAGQERFRSITEQYYRKADGVLAMYDVTDAHSFTAVRGWMDSVKEKMCEGSVLMLLGNKLDRLTDGQSRREVAVEEGQRLAGQQQALFYECSAKSGHNVEELMTHLTRRLVAQNDRQYIEALSLCTAAPQKVCCT